MMWIASMKLASILAGCVVGIDAQPVVVEAQVGRGLPGLELVGIPDRGGRESAVRVKAALSSLGVALPPRHVVVNLAPSDLRKAGASFDLAIALALLAASEAIADEPLASTLVLGELALSGELRPGARSARAAARGGGPRRRASDRASRERGRGGARSSIDVRVAGESRRGRRLRPRRSHAAARDAGRGARRVAVRGRSPRRPRSGLRATRARDRGRG